MRKFPLLITFLLCMVTGVSRAGAVPLEAGLVATYGDGKHRVVTISATPNFVLKDSESIHPQVGTSFTAEWVGVLKIVKRAKYTIVADGAAEAKILVDGGDCAGKAIELDLGDHPIKISFNRKPGAARMQLIWSADYFSAEPVPPSVLGHVGASPEAARQSQIEAGQLLVEELNCVACHRTASKTLVAHSGPDLSFVGTRLQPEWIAKWLEGPRAFWATTAMPHVPLKADECRDIAAYLGTLKNPNKKVKEPQPSPSRVETGKQLVATVGCTACHGGAKGNSLEGLGSKWLPGQLAEYLMNPQSVDHSGQMPSMLLQKDEALAIAEYLVQSKNAAFEAKVSGGDAKHGAQLVQAQGCLNCHSINTQGKRVETIAPAAIALESIDKLDRGCLAEHPSGRAMDYGLAPKQVALIGAFIGSIKEQPMATAAPVYEFYHKTKAFGCVNCHELDASLPADTTERVPLLTNVGGRLRKEWIGEVLTQKRRVRPWLRRRMPEFGAGNVGDVPGLAVAASGAGEAESLPAPTRDEIAAGQKLLGTGAGGFGCITCHGFAGAKPNVIDDTRGPDMTTVASRLRPDHFRRWVLDPKRVSPATPMPSFFDGAPAAESAAKVEAMFRYVAAGENMPPPVGFVDKNNYQVAVHDEPVMIRAFMPNPGGGKAIPRGIAVGLPGLVNYCFDADTCTLRYAWTGGFVDMQPSWAGRGGNVVKVLGKTFYQNNWFPFRVGDEKHVPEVRFEGYELVNKAPVFLYTMDGVKVRETIEFPAGTGDDGQRVFTGVPALLDTVVIESSPQSVYLVASTDRDLSFTISAVLGTPVGKTVPHGQTANLGEKPGIIQFMIPLKESK
jgi:mono/diheme cytochrome c family protein